MTSRASYCPVATLPEAEGDRDKATGQGNHSLLFSFFGLLSCSLGPRKLPLKMVTGFATLFLQMSSVIAIPPPPRSPSFPPSVYPCCSWAEFGPLLWELHSHVFHRKKKKKTKTPRHSFKLPHSRRLHPLTHKHAFTRTHAHISLSQRHGQFFFFPIPPLLFESATFFLARTLSKALRGQLKKSAPASFLRVK